MKRLVIFLLVSVCFAGWASAQDFVYQPRNPAFGGDTFNYNWLLASAQSQDLTTNDADDGFNSRNSLDSFTESLNRQLLSQLSRQIAVEQFGEEGLEDGTYTVGNFQIDVSSDLDGLSINIQDNSVGEQTQIFIPFF
ncbi:MAG: curli production assembly/transport component CsgF [Bacteroidota bacterium]